MIAVRTYRNASASKKKKAVTWVLLMDNRRAQLFTPDPEAAEPTLVPVQMEPIEIAQEPEYSHPLPRVFDSHGKQRHAVEPRHTAQETMRAQLVKEVSELLRAARLEKKYDELIVVAPKKVIGALRLSLHDVRDTIVAEVEKDLTHAPLRAISLYLSEQRLL